MNVREFHDYFVNYGGEDGVSNDWPKGLHAGRTKPYDPLPGPDFKSKDMFELIAWGMKKHRKRFLEVGDGCSWLWNMTDVPGSTLLLDLKPPGRAEMVDYADSSTVIASTDSDYFDL